MQWSKGVKILVRVVEMMAFVLGTMKFGSIKFVSVFAYLANLASSEDEGRRRIP